MTAIDVQRSLCFCSNMLLTTVIKLRSICKLLTNRYVVSVRKRYLKVKLESTRHLVQVCTNYDENIKEITIIFITTCYFECGHTLLMFFFSLGEEPSDDNEQPH